MTVEWGLFDGEGLVEGGFASEFQAEATRITMYDQDDGLEALEICPDHPGHALLGCEGCWEERENEDDEEGDWDWTR